MKLFIYLLISFLLISSVTAMNETIISEGELPDNYVSEVIDCENFKWIDDYIKSQVEENKLNGNEINLIELVSQANFGLQAELEECESKYVPYKVGVYIFGGILILLSIWNIKGIFKERKN